MFCTFSYPTATRTDKVRTVVIEYKTVRHRYVGVIYEHYALSNGITLLLGSNALLNAPQ